MDALHLVRHLRPIDWPYYLHIPNLLQELAAYRKAKEEEALKMSVLDAEAAARFSTAAALDARERLAIPASGGQPFCDLKARVLVQAGFGYSAGCRRGTAA